MTIENPERIIARRNESGILVAQVARPDGSMIMGEDDYVREDVAKNEMKSAVAVAECAVLRVALCDIGRVRSRLVNRAAGLRRIGEEARALGVEDAIKQLEEVILG